MIVCRAGFCRPRHGGRAGTERPTLASDSDPRHESRVALLVYSHQQTAPGLTPGPLVIATAWRAIVDVPATLNALGTLVHVERVPEQVVIVASGVLGLRIATAGA